MYKIQALQDLSNEALLDVAKKLALDIQDPFDKDTVVYQILDKQALVVTPTTKITKPKPLAKKTKASSTKKASVATTKGDVAPQKKKNAVGSVKKDRIGKPASHSKTSSVETAKEGGRKKDGEASKKPSSVQKKLHEITKNMLQDLAGTIEVTGVLDIMPEKYGILRSADYNFLKSPDDTYVTSNLIRTHNLKKGDTITGKVRPPKEGEKYFALVEITEINYQNPEVSLQRKDFKHLTAISPQERFKLSHKPNDYAPRIIDLFCPIGMGQRTLLVGAPKDGKSSIMQQMITGMHQNHPEAYIMQVLIWERPEEASRARRFGHSEVISCSFDESPKNAIKVVEMCIAKAKRLVEMGVDVCMFLDSLGRVCRAFNAVLPSSGRTLSGGLHIDVLQAVKRIFGAARNIEGKGSLTIVATALKDTDSRLDEVLYQEIKGTGNSDIVLDRELVRKNIYPAINLEESSTRHGEDLLSPQELKFVNMVKSAMSNMKSPSERLKFILDNMKGTATNQEFLASISY